MNPMKKIINKVYQAQELLLTRSFILNVKEAKKNGDVKEIAKLGYKYFKEICEHENKIYGIKKKTKISLIDPKKYDSPKDAPNGYTHYNPKDAPVGLNLERFTTNVLNSNTTKDIITNCVSLSSTAFHESYHQCQFHVCIDKLGKKTNNLDFLDNSFLTPKQVFTVSVEQALSDLLGEQYYEKDDNYFKILFERDARETGFDKAYSIANVLSKNPKKYFNSSTYNRLFKDAFLDNEKITSLNDENKKRYTINLLQLEDELIKNPQMLKVYPALRLAFNKDGHAKPLHEIVTDFNKRRTVIKNNRFLSKQDKLSKREDLNELYSEVFLGSLYCQPEDSIKDSIRHVGKGPIKELCQITKSYSERNTKQLLEYAKTERNARAKILSQKKESIDEIYYRRVEAINKDASEKNKLMSMVTEHVDEQIATKMSEEQIEKFNKLVEEVKRNYVEPKTYKSRTEKNAHIYEENSYLTEMRDLRDSYKERENDLVAKRDSIREEYTSISKEKTEKKEI